MSTSSTAQHSVHTAYQVGVFALVRQRGAYLIVQPRVPLLPGGGHGLPGLTLQAPSGGNIVESQLRRALLAQVGIGVSDLRLVGSHAARGVQDGAADARLNLIFGSEYCSGILNPRHDELLAAEWMDGPRLMHAGVPDYLLAAIRDFESAQTPPAAEPTGRLSRLFNRQKSLD